MSKKNLPDFRRNNRILTKINNQANVWICIFTCFLSDFNPFVICAAFIGYDIFAIIFAEIPKL